MRLGETEEQGELPYLILDARDEKMSLNGVIQDIAVLSAIGIDRQGRRSVLGVSVSYSEADIHWRTFLESLVERKLCGVEYIVTDDHAGLKMARKAVFTGAKWQRCQFHLSQNAVRHAPSEKSESLSARNSEQSTTLII